MSDREELDDLAGAKSSKDVEEDDESGFQFCADSDSNGKQTATTFTEDELALIYGGAKRVPMIGEEPSLARANVQMKTFGKSERVTSREGMNLLHRLKSIHLDSEFVARVREMFPYLKIYANLRNGRWYLRNPPDGECRFRSSDGHALSWAFHISRANLQAAMVATESKGLIIVDSTRFGKTFPDSFNRTVPLWCAIVNRALGFAHAAIELPRWLPPQEVTRISDVQLDQWSEQFKQLAASSGVELRKTLPLKPFWLANDKMAWDRCTNDLEVVKDRIEEAVDSFIPILCVSASAIIDPAIHREWFSWNYIPGGADDEENWAPTGLTASVFWEHADDLLQSENGTECENLANAILQQRKQEQHDNQHISEGYNEDASKCKVNEFLTVVWGIGETSALRSNQNEYDATWIKGQDKAWSRKNPDAWHGRAIPGVINAFVNRDRSKAFTIIGNDPESVAVLALAVLLVFFDEGGKSLLTSPRREVIDKPAIRAGEGLLVTLVDNGTLAIPRRLVKELIDFFATARWPLKIQWEKTPNS